MKRAALYARYSTDHQEVRSADDQLRFCREFAERQGFKVVLEDKDEGKSGTSIIGRLGLSRIMTAAENGEFGLLIVEALDRLARDAADANFIRKQFKFLGIEIIGINQSEQPLDSFMFNIHSAMSEHMVEETRKKVRRGMSSRALDGLHMGGAPYGYRADPLNPGKPSINEDEAEVVRRIYQECADGKTPREIARGLNADGIPAPRGGLWNASTINGSRQRRNGILRSVIYKGDLVWGRNTMIKNPKTAKRLSRSQEPLAEVEGVMPAIVPTELFDRVAEIMAQKGGGHPTTARRALRPLSGLLRCHSCGGGMSSRGTDKTGKTRIQCSRHAESGTCADPRTYYLEAVEQQVLSLLERALSEPDSVKQFIDLYNEAMLSEEADSRQERKDIERRLAKIDAECARWTDMLFRQIGDEQYIDTQLKTRKAEREVIRLRQAELDEASLVPFEPDPDAAKRYADVAAILGKVIKCGGQVPDDINREIRSLVSSVVVRPAPDGGPDTEIFGLINALALPPIPSGGLMVAEEGLEPPTQGL